MDKVVHFELPVDNPDRAKKFYKETFGWDTKDMPEMKYITAKTTEDGAGINGGMFRREDGFVNVPSFSILVEDIDEAIKKIKNAGGLILKEKMDVGDMGIMAYFKDTEGNILSVWQAKQKMQ